MVIWQFPTLPDQEGFYTLQDGTRTIRLRIGLVEGFQHRLDREPLRWLVWHLIRRHTKSGITWTDLISISFYSKTRAERIGRYFEENPERILETSRDENAFLTEEFPETEQEIAEKEANMEEFRRYEEERNTRSHMRAASSQP